jgi:hypothetical protein
MGGHFSGRRDGGPVGEDGWKFDLAHSIRHGWILPGRHVAGTMTWTLPRTGEVTASIGYEANLIDSSAAWIRLHYTITTRSTGAKTPHDYRVQLNTTRPHYGGMRWWFVCPLSGRRARVLYLPGSGGAVFASRQAWGLAYRSQRKTAEDRAIKRSLKAREKLGVQDQSLLEMPSCPRPKWMRRRTYQRLVGMIRECHAVQMGYLARRLPAMRPGSIRARAGPAASEPTPTILAPPQWRA